MEELTRRQFVKIIGLSSTVLLRATKQWGQAAVLPKAVSAQASPNKPNIVIMFLDNIGYGDLACYGNQTMKTPRIDRLAAEGRTVILVTHDETIAQRAHRVIHIFDGKIEQNIEGRKEFQ